MSEPRKKRRSGKRTALIVICVILAFILAGIAAAAIYIDYLYNRMEYVGPNGSTVSPEIASSIAQGEHVEIPPDNTDPIFDKEDITFQPDDTDHEGQGEHVVNIMLVGQDAREGESTQRSDSMILVTFNKSKETITLTSFMRDQYVQIPGYGATKLCHAYQYGGMSLLNQTIYNHFGVEIHGNLEVDFTGFEEIIDLLGGVDIELTSKEAKYLRQAGGWDVYKGMNRLPGDCALLYARLRSIDTDYRRAERQRNVMMSLMEEYKSQSYVKMVSLLNEILPLVKTNMTKAEIANYALDLFPMLSNAAIETNRIPVDGTFKGGYIRVYEGLDLWCQLNIDFAANREVLEEIFAK